jgi:hypothetical protein
MLGAKAACADVFQQARKRAHPYCRVPKIELPTRTSVAPNCTAAS